MIQWASTSQEFRLGDGGDVVALVEDLNCYIQDCGSEGKCPDASREMRLRNFCNPCTLPPFSGT